MFLKAVFLVFALFKLFNAQKTNQRKNVFYISELLTQLEAKDSSLKPLEYVTYASCKLNTRQVGNIYVVFL